MMETGIGLIRFGFSLLFGVAVSCLFAGIERTRKNNRIITFSCIILLCVQTACWWFLGINTTSKLYPFIIHVPMILLFSLYFKRSLLTSIASVLSAYLCCQAPRWIGSLAGTIFDSKLVNHMVYIAVGFLAYVFLKRYVAGSVRKLMAQSTKTRVFLGAVPLLYYVFTYLTAIYTDVLYRGAIWAIQFIPSAISVFYFVFIILYYAETQKQADAQRERDMLAVQLQLAKTEFARLRQLQECNALYRHDLRHHATFLQSLASSGNLEGIKEYLNAAQSDIDNITPMRFCENETVNLILSSCSARAAQEGVLLSVDAKLPDAIPMSDTEVCSLLSNGLENAITATTACPDFQRKPITVKVLIHKNKLLISIENSYSGEITMKNGLPQSHVEGHGYGTRSIAIIAEARGGQAIFSAERGVFNLKIMIPLGLETHNSP